MYFIASSRLTFDLTPASPHAGLVFWASWPTQTQMEITDKKLSQMKRVVGGNEKNIGQYLDYRPYCVNIRPSLRPRVPGVHWPVPGCRVLDLQPGAARERRGRFNNEFSDNCGNSTRSEIVFNFHRNKDCLSTIIRTKYFWYRNHYASPSFLCVSPIQTQSGSCQSYCGDV